MAILSFSHSSAKSYAPMACEYKPQAVRGFTLIEVTIVTAMIVILSLTVFTFGRGVQNVIILGATQSKLIALISRAKALTQGFSLASVPDGKELCGYGAHVDKAGNKIFIFQDLADKQAPTLCDSSHVYAYNNADDAALTGDINNLDLSSSDLFMDDLITLDDIVFIPPDLTVIINGDSTVTSGSIVLEVKNSASTATISVNNFGQITAE